MTSKFAYDPKQTLANIIQIHAEQRNAKEKQEQLSTTTITKKIELRNSSFHSKVLQLFKRLPNEIETKHYKDKINEILIESKIDNEIQNSTIENQNSNAMQSEIQPESYSELLIFNQNNSENDENKSHEEDANNLTNEPVEDNSNEILKEYLEIKKIKTHYSIKISNINFSPNGLWKRADNRSIYLIDKIKFLKKSIGIELQITYEEIDSNNKTSFVFTKNIVLILDFFTV